MSFVPPGAWPHFGVLLACVFLTACAQLCLKSGATGRSGTVAAFVHWQALLGYAMLATVAVLAVYASQRLPLKLITAFQSLTYVLVVIGAWTLLGEKPSRRRVIGAMVIVVGTVVFSL